MPYIKSEIDRKVLDALEERFKRNFAITGNLNYFLFKLAKNTCHSYFDFRNFIGELEAAKLEIYRRLVAPYEDEKIKVNGDVE